MSKQTMPVFYVNKTKFKPQATVRKIEIKTTAKNTLKIAAPKLFSSEAVSQLRKKKYENIKITRIHRKKKAKHFTVFQIYYLH